MEVHPVASDFPFDRVSGQRGITLIANLHKLMNWFPQFLSCVNVNQIHGLFFFSCVVGAALG